MTFPNWLHLCIDMQRMFDEDTPWHVDWMVKVLPQVDEIAGRFAAQTIFTRFVPPTTASQAVGVWQDYYKHWDMMTLARLPRDLVDVLPPLQRHIPPARVFDKLTYSPWTDGRLDALLKRERVLSVVMSGGETDVCVLAAVLGAIDLGYHVTVLSDAICSGTDETHDAALKLLRDRYSIQLDVMTAEEFLHTVQ
ncbi:cysteine hydrolase [Brucella sp. 21LCYQ03]|nr:cysteine hydrolase [Brucella sp. 21LCYQ03]